MRLTEWERERERERERKLHLWHLQGAFPSSSFLIVADYLSLHHPTQVCFFFSAAAAAVVLSSISPHVWRLLSHLLLNFGDWSSVSWDWNRLGCNPAIRVWLLDMVSPKTRSWRCRWVLWMKPSEVSYFMFLCILFTNESGTRHFVTYRAVSVMTVCGIWNTKTVFGVEHQVFSVFLP